MQIDKVDGVVDDGEMKEKKSCNKFRNCLSCNPFNKNKRGTSTKKVKGEN